MPTEADDTRDILDFRPGPTTRLVLDVILGLTWGVLLGIGLIGLGVI